MLYQLAKTSPALSGQVRWDICLKYGETSPIVDSLHIVPLSDNIIYNESNSRNTYNYSHAENVSRLYKMTSDLFYAPVRNINMDDMIYNFGYTIDPFDRSYDMGMKRMRYKRYNRQFSFLCPVWISEQIDYSKLEFYITVQNSKRHHDGPITTPYKTKLKLSEQMIDYITQYMNSSIPSDATSDDLINICFDPVNVYITGLQVNASKITTKDVTPILNNLIDRERPVMEFDNMILRLFEQYKIIAHQLINFNLVFDIDDICPEYVANRLHSEDVNVIIEVAYDGNIFDLKDLYSNYTYIPTYAIRDKVNNKWVYSDYTPNENVLSYLKDHLSKELSHTNKTVQSIFHWSLLENPEFIYNMYNGFSPIYNDGDGTYRIIGRYYDQANIGVSNASILDNNLNWCKHYSLSPRDSNYEIVDALTLPGTDKLTKFKLKHGVIWIGSDKYIIPDDAVIPNESYGLCNITYNNVSQIPSGCVSIADGQLYIYKADTSTSTNIAFLSDTSDNLTLANIYNILLNDQTVDIPEEVKDLITEVKDLITILYNNWQAPYKIDFYKSIQPSLVQFDNKYAQVVNYGKIDNSFHTYVYRYTGKIIPCFIDMNDDIRYNYDFYYKQYSNTEDEFTKEYIRLLTDGYKAEYLEMIGNDIYENSFYPYITCKRSVDYPEWYDDNNWNGDISWLNDNSFWILPTSISIISKIPNYKQYSNEEIDDIIYNNFIKYFKNEQDSVIKDILNSEEVEWMKRWLRKRYTIESQTFEYESKYNIDDIKFDTKFSLK